jgi:quercetin dioxygenase-like cupin family protein
MDIEERRMDRAIAGAKTGVPLIHEDEVAEVQLPGRHLRWLVNGGGLPAAHASMCVIRVAPGETVRPAHSHPDGEEVIYILSGKGRVMVEGAVDQVAAGTVVLFPQGAVHMLQNNGTEEMKVACFFAPAADFSSYRFFDEIEFPA